MGASAPAPWARWRILPGRSLAWARVVPAGRSGGSKELEQAVRAVVQNVVPGRPLQVDPGGVDGEACRGGRERGRGQTAGPAGGGDVGLGGHPGIGAGQARALQQCRERVGPGSLVEKWQRVDGQAIAPGTLNLPGPLFGVGHGPARVAVTGDEGVEVHQRADLFRGTVGGAGDDAAAVAVPDQHHRLAGGFGGKGDRVRDLVNVDRPG